MSTKEVVYVSVLTMSVKKTACIPISIISLKKKLFISL